MKKIIYKRISILLSAVVLMTSVSGTAIFAEEMSTISENEPDEIVDLEIESGSENNIVKPIDIGADKVDEDIPLLEEESVGANPTWNDWVAEIDSNLLTITLIQYVGNETSIIIPSKVSISGNEYSVILQGTNKIKPRTFPQKTKAITIENGVKAASDISYLFYSEDGELDSLNINKLDTSQTTNMKGLFYGCRKISKINLSGLDTSNVTDMEEMFYLCNVLSDLDISGINTSKVRKMNYMFGECHMLSAINLSGFNTINVENMSGMFSYCGNLTSLNLSSFNTKKCTNMNSMFGNCRELINLELKNFETQRCCEMGSMFSGCSKIKKLDLSNFDTSNVKSFSCMFYGCSQLEELNLNCFDTEDSDRFDRMFENCSSLQTLDLSTFTVKNAFCYQMFSGCTSLRTIIVEPDTDWNLTMYDPIFGGCENLSGDISYDSSKTTGDYAKVTGGYFTAKTGDGIKLSPRRITIYCGHDERLNSATITADKPEGYLDSDLVWKSSDTSVAVVDNGVITSVSAGTATIKVSTYDGKYLAACNVTVSDICEDGYLLNDWVTEVESENKIVKYIQYIGTDTSITIPSMVDISGNDYSVVLQGTNSYYTATFPFFIKSVTIQNGVKAAEDISYLFYSGNGPRGDTEGAGSISYIDLSGLDTSSTKNMEALFYECGVPELDLSSFDTSKVTNMKNMFFSCDTLETIDFSHFDTSNVIDMSFMFENCWEIKSLDLSYFNANFA